MWTSGFNRYKNVYTYRSQEFRTSLKNYAINLDSSYYLFIKKNIKHAIEHDIDSAYGVWIH